MPPESYEVLFIRRNALFEEWREICDTNTEQLLSEGKVFDAAQFLGMRKAQREHGDVLDDLRRADEELHLWSQRDYEQRIREHEARQSKLADGVETMVDAVSPGA